MLKFLTNPDTWLTKNVLIISFEYTPVTQIILCMIILICVATIQHYRGQESKTHFEVYISDTSTTLKQGQGHKN